MAKNGTSEEQLLQGILSKVFPRISDREVRNHTRRIARLNGVISIGMIRMIVVFSLVFFVAFRLIAHFQEKVDSLLMDTVSSVSFGIVVSVVMAYMLYRSGHFELAYKKTLEHQRQAQQARRNEQEKWKQGRRETLAEREFRIFTYTSRPGQIIIMFADEDRFGLDQHLLPKVSVNGQSCKTFIFETHHMIVDIRPVLRQKNTSKLELRVENANALIFDNPYFLTLEMLQKAEIKWQCLGEPRDRRIEIRMPKGVRLVDHSAGWEFAILANKKLLGTVEGIPKDGVLTIPIPDIHKSMCPHGTKVVLRYEYSRGVSRNLPEPVWLSGVPSTHE